MTELGATFGPDVGGGDPPPHPDEGLETATFEGKYITVRVRGLGTDGSIPKDARRDSLENVYKPLPSVIRGELGPTAGRTEAKTREGWGTVKSQVFGLPFSVEVDVTEPSDYTPEISRKVRESNPVEGVPAGVPKVKQRLVLVEGEILDIRTGRLLDRKYYMSPRLKRVTEGEAELSGELGGRSDGPSTWVRHNNADARDVTYVDMARWGTMKREAATSAQLHAVWETEVTWNHINDDGSWETEVIRFRYDATVEAYFGGGGAPIVDGRFRVYPGDEFRYPQDFGVHD